MDGMKHGMSGGADWLLQAAIRDLRLDHAESQEAGFRQLEPWLIRTLEGVRTGATPAPAEVREEFAGLEPRQAARQLSEEITDALVMLTPDGQDSA